MVLCTEIDCLSVVEEKFDELVVFVVEDGEEFVLGFEFGLAVESF